MRYFGKIKVIYITLLIFFFLNLFSLTYFPFIHSDESWLSGLSRNILEEEALSVTETFFDLYPRNPHAIKIIFHIIQIVFIKLMGYRIFTFRFISLLAGTLYLFLYYKLAKKITKSDFLANTGVIMMGIDIQFIYASHFARQEIILLVIFLAGFNYYIEHKKGTIKHDIVLGLILGISIGIHPNSFVISLPFIIVYTYNLFLKNNSIKNKYSSLLSKKIKTPNYFAFIGALGGMALFFVLLSFNFNSNFIHDYASYGKKLGVLNSIISKIDSLDYFYKKLFYGISGTYYTPPVKFQFIIFSLSIIYTILQLFINKLAYGHPNVHGQPQSFPPLNEHMCLTSFRKKLKLHNFLVLKNFEDKNLLLLMFIGINAGFIIIGRYNQTGIIFIFPICYLIILNIISSMKRNFSLIITTLIIVILAFNTGLTLTTDTHYNYNSYINEIAKVVEKDDKVLANLNSEFYFKNGKLLDYRNLAFLNKENISFSEYIKENKIEYIIYPEEMDFIYNNRPVWNIIYGNLYPYYQDMKKYLENECRMVHSFTNKTYGMRIVRYIGKRNWKIKIYKVND